MRWWIGIAFMAGLAGAALAGGSCWGGDEATCGDGKVGGAEQCDDGNDEPWDGCANDCRSRAANNVTVRWTLVGDAAPGFSGESCNAAGGGIGADSVRLQVSGPESLDEPFPCTYSQTLLPAMAPGDYVVQATLLRGADEVISRTVGVPFTVPDAGPVTATVNFVFDDFLESYAGQFLFEINWGGARECDAAVPPVTHHVLLLERDGAPLVGATDAGDPIDGSAEGACRSESDPFAQSVAELPWGPATFTITGLDETGTARFRETFPTFIGAGLSNPTITFDVNSLTPDAGPPDAGPPDAPPPDGGLPDAAPADAGAPDAT